VAAADRRLSVCRAISSAAEDVALTPPIGTIDAHPNPSQDGLTIAVQNDGDRREAKRNAAWAARLDNSTTRTPPPPAVDWGNRAQGGASTGQARDPTGHQSTVITPTKALPGLKGGSHPFFGCAV